MGHLEIIHLHLKKNISSKMEMAGLGISAAYKDRGGNLLISCQMSVKLGRNILCVKFILNW